MQTAATTIAIYMYTVHIEGCVDCCRFRFSAVPALSQEKTPNNSELSIDSVRLRKLPKVHHRQDETTRRRQTINVPDDVTAALASHSNGRPGRVQRDLSMKLPPSAGKREAESELERAFSKFRRATPETAPSRQTAASSEPSSKAGVRERSEDVKKPPVCARSNLLPSQKLTTVSLQPDKDGLSQPRPAWNSMLSLVSDENVIQKPSLMKTSHTFESTDVLLTSDTKRSSVAPTGNSSDSHSSSSAQENIAGTCVKTHADDEISHSAEMESEKCSLNNSVSRNADKKLAKMPQHTSVFAITHSHEKFTSSQDALSISPPGDRSESKLMAKASNLSTNLEQTATNVPKQEHPSDAVSKKQKSSAAEAVASSTTCLVQNSVSVVSAIPEVEEPPACRQMIARQKSCPEKPEPKASSTAAQLLHRSLDAADEDGSANIPSHPLEQLRSCALWKTDESGNKTEIKLKKSHSIALKPRKNPTDASPSDESVQANHKHTTSSINRSSSALQDVSPLMRQVKISTPTSDKLADGTSVCQSDQAQIADSLTSSGLVQHIHSVKAGEVVAGKKLSSMALTGSRCEDMPTLPMEPIWLALARQKRQRWTEGAV